MFGIEVVVLGLFVDVLVCSLSAGSWTVVAAVLVFSITSTASDSLLLMSFTGLELEGTLFLACVAFLILACR